MFTTNDTITAIDADGNLDNRNLIVATLSDFSESDPVRVDAETTGVVVEVNESNFTWPPDEENGEEIEASKVDPVYEVALDSGGTKPFRADEIESVDREGAFGTPDDVEKPPETAAEGAELREVYRDPGLVGCDEVPHCGFLKAGLGVEELIDVPTVDDPGVGWSGWPPSWRKSERPNRVILLDAWTSMGATFRGCRREMAGNIRNPNAFCASMKDTIYSHTHWRQGE